MNIEEAVEILGSFDDPIEIARYLQSEGVKGYTADEASCPLAVWLSRETEIAVSVTDDYILEYGDPDNWMTCTEHPVTSAIVDFIRMFDAGAFPLLDREMDQ